MSDPMRKSFTDKATESATPDSQKSATQKVSEGLSNTTDRVAGAVQPDSDKSTGQKLGDTTRSGGDKASNQGEGVLKQAQDTLNSAGQSISDSLSGATGQKK